MKFVRTGAVTISAVLTVGQISGCAKKPEAATAKKPNAKDVVLRDVKTLSALRSRFSKAITSSSKAVASTPNRSKAPGNRVPPRRQAPPPREDAYDFVQREYGRSNIDFRSPLAELYNMTYPEGPPLPDMGFDKYPDLVAPTLAALKKPHTSWEAPPDPLWVTVKELEFKAYGPNTLKGDALLKHTMYYAALHQMAMLAHGEKWRESYPKRNENIRRYLQGAAEERRRRFESLDNVNFDPDAWKIADAPFQKKTTRPGK